ncbi:MAG TPA: acetolactate synthase large subunit, partial [Xanthomonadales bacterium]|nr:acetolactate synthase large subunit [Xanthomonadales bacterium]
MNGAENLLNTLVAAGVEVCFANPGTSEMQLVSAIGNSDRMRAVLCLFEGVVSGAADGYGRMADKPALTLLHLGSGFANSMANQHNARRAHVPLVNMVGDHATYHLQYDAPLTSDVKGHCELVSSWVGVAGSADDLATVGAKAVQAAMQNNGQIASFIAPADCTWEPASQAAAALPVPVPEKITDPAIERIAAVLGNGKRTALFLGGRALRADNLQWAGRIARKCGAVILCETFPARLQRGAGRVPVQRLPYFAEQALAALQDFEQLVLIGSKSPVSFFAYPGKPSNLVPPGCAVETLAGFEQDIADALSRLARNLGADADAVVMPAAGETAAPMGLLTPEAIGLSITRSLPANTIVSDEAATCGLGIFGHTQQAVAHDWLTLTGGAIGQGLPLALGAAIACPERKVLALQADGSGMYTLQALWSMVREQVDVTVVIMNNHSYAILGIELTRVGAGQPTPKTLSMLSLANPKLDWVELALGMGMPASRAGSAEEFDQQFSAAMASKG